jgi:hypothetical protein
MTTYSRQSTKEYTLHEHIQQNTQTEEVEEKKEITSFLKITEKGE